MRYRMAREEYELGQCTIIIQNVYHAVKREESRIYAYERGLKSRRTELAGAFSFVKNDERKARERELAKIVENRRA